MIRTAHACSHIIIIITLATIRTAGDRRPPQRILIIHVIISFVMLLQVASYERFVSILGNLVLIYILNNTEILLIIIIVYIVSCS